MAENNPNGGIARDIAEKSTKRSRKGKEKHFEGWGATPALQKLRHLAVWLRNSTLHADLWDDAIGITLGVDNDTRWSSWYYVINRAIRKKDEIIKFLHENADACGPNILTHADWEILGHTHTFLKVFSSGTLWVEGDQSGLSQSLELMDVILQFFEQQKV
jgi:hypothetical protein